jgi:O-antigen/teichoic acid export membrane protein
MNSLKQQTVNGFKWTFGGSIVQRIVSFGTMIVLARILSPADFGLFALAFVMIDGFGIFKSLGFDSALIRQKGSNIEKACNTVFLLIPAMGVMLFLILFIVAPIGAKFLNNISATNVIRSLAVVFLFSCFAKVPQTLLTKELKFKQKTYAETSGSIVYSFSAVTLALAGMGVWSLVVGFIIKSLVQSTMEWVYAGWRPRFEFDKTVALEMFHFGKYILASSFIGFLYSSLDKITIAKLLNVEMLGYYAMAMNISSFFIDFVFNRVGNVMYPTYSKINDRLEDVRRIFLKSLKYIALVAFPFSFALILYAPDLIRIVYGDKWLPAVSILRVLALVGLFRSFGVALWPVFLARGQSKLDFQISIAQTVLFFVLVIPLALKYKLMGVGFAVLISYLIGFVIGLIRLKDILRIRFAEILKVLRPVLAASLFMLTSGFFLNSFPVTQIRILHFVISAAVSTSLYFFITYLLNRSFWKESKEIFA